MEHNRATHHPRPPVAHRVRFVWVGAVRCAHLPRGQLCTLGRALARVGKRAPAPAAPRRGAAHWRAAVFIFARPWRVGWGQRCAPAGRACDARRAGARRALGPVFS